MYFSQQGEDKFIFENYLNYNDGFFIELGAMDGIEFSNSLFFERSLGWKGVLIEPTTQYEKLVNNRPNCFNFNYAISENDGEIEFLGDGALGGIIKSMSNWHRIGWRLDELYKPTFVKTKPISKLLQDIEIDIVDFFSIDVEGGELSVLKTFDWSIPVYLILIEGCYTASEDLKKEWLTKPNQNNILIDEDYIKRIEECSKILIENGFVFETTIGGNEIWINKENKRKKI